MLGKNNTFQFLSLYLALKLQTIRLKQKFLGKVWTGNEKFRTRSSKEEGGEKSEGCQQCWEQRGVRLGRAGTIFTVDQFFTDLNMTSDDLQKFQEQLLAYASDNLVKINAFFDSPYLSKYQTDEVTVVFLPICTGACFKVMSATTFIANIGGMLGLCMGFSFVSLVEIFFFIVQFIVSKFQREKWKDNFERFLI